MEIIKFLEKLPRRIYHRLFEDDDIYIHKISDSAPWALVCYIPFVFYCKHDKELMDRHQSQWEAIEIDKVLTSLGYNVYNLSFSATSKLPDIDFKLIIGLEPAFCEACKKYPNAKKKIYYATGAYVGHQNGMVKKLTDDFNAKYKVEIPYRRTAPDNDAAHLADEILQIGSKYTISTYPSDLQHKICLIHQSTQASKTVSTIEYAPENEYFFMSSSGNILKGIPQMIEAFTKHPELILHIVGPIEEDVKTAMTNMLSPNIIFHGFMNINSQEYMDIIKRCNFNIYPSSSEGMPGAVLNSMKNGLIPIVSKWSSFDEIEEYGYQLRDIDVSSIEDSLEWTKSLSKSRVLEMKVKSNTYVANTYNLERFASEFSEYFKRVMSR